MSNNLFEHCSDDELLIFLDQYKEWNVTCTLPDNELGKMRDKYIETFNNTWQICLIVDLLSTIADRWKLMKSKYILE